jgi:hypothetical protein
MNQTDHGHDARHEILARTLEGLRDRRLGCLSITARISAVENDVERILEFLLGDYPEGDRTTGGTGK